MNGANERFKRQLLLKEIGAQGQKKLQKAAILLIGLGGVGSPVALYLAAAGVGQLDVMDHDRIDISNLNRQILFTEKDLGEAKAPVAIRRLRALHSGTDYRAFPVRMDANIPPAVDHARYDLVIDATDNFATRRRVNAFCVARRLCLLSASVASFSGLLLLLAPHFYTPMDPQRVCYHCLAPESPFFTTRDDCAHLGILGAMAGVVGALAALEALKHLCGESRLLNHMLYVRGLEGQVKQIRLRGDPACPVCRAETSY